VVQYQKKNNCQAIGYFAMKKPLYYFPILSYFTHLKVSLLSTNNNTMNYFSTDFKLGILGGGQLGKMMLF
jgi:hypothetical protein